MLQALKKSYSPKHKIQMNEVKTHDIALKRRPNSAESWCVQVPICHSFSLNLRYFQVHCVYEKFELNEVRMAQYAKSFFPWFSLFSRIVPSWGANTLSMWGLVGRGHE